MKILITGGAGCLGANLIDRWIPAGHDVLVLDNLATGYAESLAPDARLIKGSIADKTLVDQAFAEFKPDWVVHSAAAYKDPSDWASDAQTNVLGTINVVDAARAANVSRFINFQTALCYGRPSQVPIPVDHPTAPFTSYGISKTAAEQYLMMSDLNAVSLRLANVTGPRLAIGPIPTFYTRLKSGKSCFCSKAVRDFLDMSDFIEVVDLLLSNSQASGVFNVSTGEGHSIKDVFDAVVAYLGIELDEPVPVTEVGDDDVATVVLDPSATAETLGWRPQVNFDEMMHRMLSWYDQHGVTAIYSHLAAPK